MVGGVEKPAPPDPPSKRQHDGVDYDFVFSIDVKDDEPPLPLPYNHGGALRELDEPRSRVRIEADPVCCAQTTSTSWPPALSASMSCLRATSSA